MGYSTNKKIWNHRKNIVSAFEQNGSTIIEFRKPERIEVDEAPPKILNQE